MAPVGYMQIAPGEKILDLCAAPGGKSTQIAAALKGSGILVCNEINQARAKILSQNIERMGVRNAMVLNETPEHLAEVFPGFFDRILVDAPCSGEGMFRKNEEAVNEWSTENVDMCAARQAGILDAAAVMLSPGGRLVYSTCTFAPEEDEGSISEFVKRHPEYHIVHPERYPGMDEGHPEWIDDPAEGISYTVRLWPHRIKGEGHFIAVLERDGVKKASVIRHSKGEIQEKDIRSFREFCSGQLKTVPDGRLLFFGDQLYMAPDGMPPTRGLKILRPGLHMGTIKKDRFEPSHSLALALAPSEAKYVYDMKGDGQEIQRYLNGQTLNVDGVNGWYLMTVDGYSIGWGKLAAGIMKNHYPKGLRINY